jgi:hypothetical protein
LVPSLDGTTPRLPVVSPDGLLKPGHVPVGSQQLSLATGLS